MNNILAGALIKIFPAVKWRISTNDKILFLTFDDGPVAGVTNEVLDLLAANHAKATFFCIGENIQKNPVIFSRIISEGHVIGNHTHNHPNGWTTHQQIYLQNVSRCDEAIRNNHNLKTDGQVSRPLFRPPYGKLKPLQYLALRQRYQIIMWDVIARDWDPVRTGNSCFELVKKKSKAGSIIVFHDSIKAKERMIPALEKTLAHFSELGYRFESLEKFT